MRKQDLNNKLFFTLSTVLLAFTLSACSQKAPFHAVCDQVQGSPQMITYPDGQVIKSDVTKCNDGCAKYSDVNNPNTTFNSCDGG